MCLKKKNFIFIVIMIIIVKGDFYVKFVVDGKQLLKKIEVVRKIWELVWDEEFIM